MFFQETTPNTSGYMIAGYAISFIVLGLYVASIYLRNRNLQQDMSMLEEMEQTNPMTEAKMKQSAKVVTKKNSKK